MSVRVERTFHGIAALFELVKASEFFIVKRRIAISSPALRPRAEFEEIRCFENGFSLNGLRESVPLSNEREKRIRLRRVDFARPTREQASGSLRELRNTRASILVHPVCLTISKASAQRSRRRPSPGSCQSRDHATKALKPVRASTNCPHDSHDSDYRILRVGLFRLGNFLVANPCFLRPILFCSLRPFGS